MKTKKYELLWFEIIKSDPFISNILYQENMISGYLCDRTQSSRPVFPRQYKRFHFRAKLCFPHTTFVNDDSIYNKTLILTQACWKTACLKLYPENEYHDLFIIFWKSFLPTYIFEKLNKLNKKIKTVSRWASNKNLKI